MEQEVLAELERRLLCGMACSIDDVPTEAGRQQLAETPSDGSFDQKPAERLGGPFWVTLIMRG